MGRCNEGVQYGAGEQPRATRRAPRGSFAGPAIERVPLTDNFGHPVPMGSRILDAGVAVAAVLSAVLLGLMLAAPLLPQAAPAAVATATPEPSSLGGCPASTHRPLSAA